MREPVDDDAWDISGNGVAEEHSSQADVIQHCTKDLFCFTETQGGSLNIRDCATPEIVPCRMSLNPEPIWLDRSECDFEGGTTEEHNGFSLSCPDRLYVLRSIPFLVQCMISCFSANSLSIIYNFPLMWPHHMLLRYELRDDLARRGLFDRRRCDSA